MASPLLVNVVELTRRQGTLKDIQLIVPASVFAFDDARIADTDQIDVDLHLESVSGVIVVNGTVAGKWATACRRCLRELHLVATAEVDELYQQVVDNPDAYPMTGEQLDLTGMARETLLLAMADAPLCRPDCPGLCPQCGADLTTAPCGCQAQRTDERWAILDQLRGELD